MCCDAVLQLKRAFLASSPLRFLCKTLPRAACFSALCNSCDTSLFKSCPGWCSHPSFVKLQFQPHAFSGEFSRAHLEFDTNRPRSCVHLPRKRPYRSRLRIQAASKPSDPCSSRRYDLSSATPDPPGLLLASRMLQETIVPGEMLRALGSHKLAVPGEMFKKTELLLLPFFVSVGTASDKYSSCRIADNGHMV